MKFYDFPAWAQALFEKSGEALFLLDLDTEQLLDANPMAQRLSGCTCQELVGAPIQDWFRSESQDGLQRLRRAYQNTENLVSPEAFWMRSANKSAELPVSLTITRVIVGPATAGLITATAGNQAADAIRMNEERFRTLVEKSADGICLADAAGVIQYASPAVASILGSSAEELLGRTILEYIHPEDQSIFANFLAQLLRQSGEDLREAFRVRRQNGASRHVEGIGNNRLDDPSVRAIVLNCRDITERKRAETLLAGQKRVLEMIATRASLTAVLNTLVEVIEAHLDGAVCSILLVDDESLCLRYGSAPSLPEDYHRAIDGLVIGPHASACGTAVFRREPVLSTDITTDPLWDGNRERALSHGLRACWSYPILDSDGQVLGTFAAYSNHPATPSERDLQLMEFAVQLAAVAIKHRRAEERIQFQANLLNQVDEVIIATDIRRRITYWNRGAEKLYRVPAFQALGRQAEEICRSRWLQPEDERHSHHALQSQGSWHGHTLQMRGNGEEIHVESAVSVLRGNRGQAIGLLSVLHDVTERRQAEEALRTSEAKYRSLIENLEQGVFLKDRQLRFVVVNRPFCQALNRKEADIVGKTDFDFYPQAMAEKYRADDFLVLTEGKRLELEEQILSQGQTRALRVVKTPVRDSQGRIVGVLCICWDVTEQRALETQLRQAQKMDAVGQLAGGIAHDFNNLLTAILGNLALILSNLPERDPNHELATAVDQAATRAANLTSQLLSFSRRGLIRPQTLHLQTIIDEVAALLRRTIDPRIRLETRRDPALGMVRADPGQMNQVLMNLCLNARDAMPDGGLLLLETHNVEIDEEYARLHLEARPGKFVRLRVSDTGHGIPPDIRSRIFEPFFTTKGPGKGTGLGLAMVFGIIKQHQGWIDCYSETGYGTRFDIYLPLVATTQSLVPAPTSSATPCRGHETILLADDEAMIRTLGQAILQRYGYRVLLAEDGLQAVSVYQQNQGEIDLVILDLTMPELSGRDAFRQLLHINPNIRVLFASGYSAEHVAEIDHECVLGFVDKPYRPEELAHTIRSALDHPVNRNRPRQVDGDSTCTMSKAESQSFSKHVCATAVSLDIQEAVNGDCER